MKISVSLSESDLAVLDDYVSRTGVASRSAAVQLAIRQLRLPELEQDYAAAWDEWASSGDEQAWSTAGADGLADAAR